MLDLTSLVQPEVNSRTFGVGRHGMALLFAGGLAVYGVKIVLPTIEHVRTTMSITLAIIWRFPACCVERRPMALAPSVRPFHFFWLQPPRNSISVAELLSGLAHFPNQISVLEMQDEAGTSLGNCARERTEVLHRWWTPILAPPSCPGCRISSCFTLAAG